MQYQNQDNNKNNTSQEDDNLNFSNTSQETEENLNSESESYNNNNETPPKASQEDYKDKYLRSLAEFENLKKHSSKLLEEANCYAITKFAKELLSVMDVFTKAIASLDANTITEPTFKSFVDGIILTKQELNKIFKKFNITILDKTIIGEVFDPNFQEALLAKEDPNKENETIFEVFEDGYLLKDKLLRPAKVGIIKNS